MGSSFSVTEFTFKSWISIAEELLETDDANFLVDVAFELYKVLFSESASTSLITSQGCSSTDSFIAFSNSFRFNLFKLIVSLDEMLVEPNNKQSNISERLISVCVRPRVESIVEYEETHTGCRDWLTGRFAKGICDGKDIRCIWLSDDYLTVPARRNVVLPGETLKGTIWDGLAVP